jgi:membrane protease YdiL (CAAX protease family)
LSGPLRGPALGHGAIGLLRICGIEMLVFGLFIGLAWLASRASTDDLLLRWRGGVWTIPLGLAYSIGLRLVVAFVIILLGLALIGLHLSSAQELQRFLTANRPDVEAIVDVSALRQDPVYFWLSLTLVSFVVAGLREELWRSTLLAALRRLWPGQFGSRTGQVVAVGLAAVVFGLGHLPQGPVAVGATAVLGFALGLIMVFHGSIWPAVLAHGFFDATSLALLPWAMNLLRQFA